MAIKKNLIVVLGISIIITLNSCGKKGCANTAYNFVVGVKAYPDKESIRLGDTLWFEINAPTNLTDITSNTTIDYSGAENLGSAIGFGRITNNITVESADTFSYITKVGVPVSNPNTTKIREFLFVQINKNYVFKLGIIPKEKGVFGVGFSNAANVYRSSDKCTKAAFKINFENTHQHYYLNPIINSTNSDTTKSSGSYYFKVN